MNKLQLSFPHHGALRIPLAADEVVSLKAAAGHTLETLCGRAWVTFQGDREDHLLAPGERIALNGRGQVVAAAIGNTELRLATAGLAAAPATPKRAASAHTNATELEQRVSRWRDQRHFLAPYASMERLF